MESHRQARRHRRKRCRSCQELFDPDTRTKGRQRHCSRPECQTIRQRQNEKDWRRRNPESRREENRKWRQRHREYSRLRRLADPGFEAKNREDTRERMGKRRYLGLFDKSKSIMTQVVGGHIGKCYLTHGKRWLMVRLTRASPLSKPVFMRDNRCRFKRVRHRWPTGRIYDLGEIFQGGGSVWMRRH